jgi:nucleotidyltransferase substrate binding protein (TIGR01987 family)
MTGHDVRWRQRSSNFRRALARLVEAVDLSGQRTLSDLERQGLIQAFEFTHELGWNVLKDYLEQQGIFGLIGSRDASRSAFQNGLITDGEAWMEMIRHRNLSTHTYDEATVQEIVTAVVSRYIDAFQGLETQLQDWERRP